jgi:hypothetical protein
MHSALQNPEYEIKQKVLQLVVDRIVVDEQQLTIHHVVPTGPVKLQMGPQNTDTSCRTIRSVDTSFSPPSSRRLSTLRHSRTQVRAVSDRTAIPSSSRFLLPVFVRRP